MKNSTACTLLPVTDYSALFWMIRTGMNTDHRRLQIFGVADYFLQMPEMS